MPSDVFGPMPKSSATTSNLRKPAPALQIKERNNHNDANEIISKRLKNIKTKELT